MARNEDVGEALRRVDYEGVSLAPGLHSGKVQILVRAHRSRGSSRRRAYQSSCE